MPQITITFEATGGTVSSGRSFDASVETRFVDWLWTSGYAPADEETGEILPRTPANEAKAFKAWVQTTLTSTWKSVKRREEINAAVQAEAGIDDITDTEV